jgi:hypothetical protein
MQSPVWSAPDDVDRGPSAVTRLRTDGPQVRGGRTFNSMATRCQDWRSSFWCGGVEMPSESGPVTLSRKADSIRAS